MRDRGGIGGPEEGRWGADGRGEEGRRKKEDLGPQRSGDFGEDEKNEKK